MLPLKYQDFGWSYSWKTWFKKEKSLFKIVKKIFLLKEALSKKCAASYKNWGYIEFLPFKSFWRKSYLTEVLNFFPNIDCFNKKINKNIKIYIKVKVMWNLNKSLHFEKWGREKKFLQTFFAEKTTSPVPIYHADPKTRTFIGNTCRTILNFFKKKHFLDVSQYE